jgi:tetratricopeptide (TPR) repeat protein
MKVDGDVEPFTPEASPEGGVVAEPRDTGTPRKDDELVEMGIPPKDGSGRVLDDVGEMGVRKPDAQGTDERRREDYVAEQPQPDEKDPHLLLVHHRFIDEHDGNIVLDGIHPATGLALEAGTVPDELYRCLAVRAGENFEEFGIDGHCALRLNSRTITSCVKIVVMSHMRTACLIVALVTGLVPDLAFAQGPADAYFEFLMARRLESEGDNRGALTALERAAAADPNSAEIRAEIASFHLRRNQRAEAEKAALAALALDDKNVEANRVLGNLYAAAAEGGGQQRISPEESARNVAAAITYLERAAAGSPTTDATLLFTLGRMYTRRGDTEKAVQALTRVLGQNPNSFQGRLALAQAYAAGKDLKSAIAVLEEVFEDDPRVASALGQYQEQAGLLAEAAATYTVALLVQPMSRELKFRRIAVLYNAEQYARAAGFAAEARKQHPEDPRFPQLQARALFDAGDRTGALAVMESAVKSFPKDPAPQYALADLYTDAGRLEDAERVLRQVLAASPDDPNALNYLGYHLAVRGDQLDEAIRLVRRALAADPDNAAYLDSLGWAYFQRGDLVEAEKYLGAAAAQLPENSEIQEHLGDVLARRGRLDEAISAWTRALSGNGSNINRTAVQKKIDDARAKARQ